MAPISSAYMAPRVGVKDNSSTTAIKPRASGVTDGLSKGFSRCYVRLVGVRMPRGYVWSGVSDGVRRNNKPLRQGFDNRIPSFYEADQPSSC